MATTEDDFAGLVGWRRRAFSPVGRGHVLVLHDGHVSLFDRDDNAKVAWPLAWLAALRLRGADEL